MTGGGLRTRRPPVALRSPAALTALIALLAGLLTLAAPPAHADGYRYWSFWERTGDTWSYADKGPSFLRPDDGAVLGLRFTVGEDSEDAGRPRGSADFGAICAGTPAKSGAKRIALVIDFGTAADAPSGRTPPKARTECARVGGNATAADALAATAKPLRYNSEALLCAIAGYPESGCGEQVSGSGKETGSPTAKDDGGGGDGGGGDGGGLSTGLGVAVGAGAVVLLGAGAYWQSRRRTR